jgi:hypothetical protein
MEIEIKYNQRQTKVQFYLGGAFLLLWIIAIVSRVEGFTLSYTLVIGIVYLLGGYYNYKTPYFQIQGNQIRSGWKKRQLDDLKAIKYFAADFTLSFHNAKPLVVDTNYVDKESLQKLRDTMEALQQKLADKLPTD